MSDTGKDQIDDKTWLDKIARVMYPEHGQHGQRFAYTPEFMVGEIEHLVKRWKGQTIGQAASSDPVYTVRDAYGKALAELTPPQGSEFTGEFREPVEGEMWMTTDGYSVIKRGLLYAPRLILRPVKRTRKRIVFTERERSYEVVTGEWVSQVGFRETVPYLATENHTGQNRFADLHVIYDRREEEVQDA